MSRRLDSIALSTLLLLAAGSSGEALAQPGRPGAAAPHPAMAAPHIAAPAPHMAAPHFAAPAPRMAAPAPHFAAPAPHMAAAPHFAAPARNFAAHGAPHIAAPRGAPHTNFAHIERGRTAPQAGRFASHAIRHNDATPSAREAARHGPLPSRQANRPDLAKSGREAGPGPIGSRAERHPPGTAGQTVGSTAHQTVGRNETAANQARNERPRTPPILQNSAFANQRIAAASHMTPAQQTFRGRFAQAGWARDWRHHHHHLGIVLGFVGPVFWPYAYDDFVDYTFAPYAYDTFWPYAFDDVYAGIYGGYAPEYYGPEDAYAYAGSAASQSSYARTAATTNGTSGPAAAGGSDRICSSEAAGVTDFSIQKIAQQVNPDEKQQALLDQLKAASTEAVKALQAACPSELPSTPTGRLAAMRARVDAMLKAVQTVRPALEKFYASLSDEQRERFNALDQSQQIASTQPAEIDRLCKRHEAASHALPIERIERTLQLSTNQDAALKELDQTTAKAADLMQANCQPAQTLTPTGRLAAMENRLSTMSQALQMTETALNKFYGALSDEQKAQFDRMSIRTA
jgi:LTXXQ motif family protein